MNVPKLLTGSVGLLWGFFFKLQKFKNPCIMVYGNTFFL